MTHVFLTSGFSQEDVEEVALHFDLDKDGEISYAEFAALTDEAHIEHEKRGRRVEELDCLLQTFRQSVDLRYSSYRDAFRAMDKDRDSSLSPQELYAALLAHDVVVNEEQLGGLYAHFDPQGTGSIKFTAFCKVLGGAPQYGRHLRRQMFQPR